jgi:hypothetical protein
MINKTLYIVAAVLFWSLHLIAQEQDAPRSRPDAYIGHELVIAHGYMPLSQYNMKENREVVALGAISAGYRYHFSRLMSVGVLGSFEHSSNSYPSTGTPTIRYTSIRGVQSCYTMATEFTFNYLTLANGAVRLYGLVGGGYSVYFHDRTYKINGVSGRQNTSQSIDATLQIVPIGVRFGKALGGFMEFGSGYRGIVNFGVSYRY